MPGDRLRRGDYAVMPIGLADARNLIERYHYAGGASNTATFLHGLFQRDDPSTPLGAAWWIPPTRTAAAASWGGSPEGVLALSRLVIAPEVPKNAATFLLARSVRAIRRDGRYLCLITYADVWQGHEGGIYRAAGWEYLGLTAPEPTFVDRDGHLVARKAGPKTRTRAEMEALGHRRIGAYSKHKFRLIVRPTKKRPDRRGQMILEGV